MSCILKTERLELRRIKRADAGAIATLANDLEVSRWLTRVPFPYMHTDAAQFSALVEDDALDHFVVLFEDAPIGVVSCQNQLGYWIGRRYWKRGFGREAAQAMIDYYFSKDRACLNSSYFDGNTASADLLSHFGFKRTGSHEASCLATGRNHLQHDVSLLRTTWEARI